MTNNSDSADELMELERETFRRRCANDFGWMIEAHAQDALLLPPGAGVLNAKDVLTAAKERVANAPPPTGQPSFSWEPTKAVVNEADDMGYVYGTTREEKDDGDVVLGKYVSVWVREGDSWKVAVEIRNDN